MNDREALYVAIAHNPHEDTPRLMLADWLEEHGDDHDRRHAGLIRVQCELPRYSILVDDYKNCSKCDGTGDIGDYHTSRNCRRCEGTGKEDHKVYKWVQHLLTRERELLAVVEPVVRRGAKCGRCGGYRYPGKVPDDANLRNPTWLDCPDCHGGYTGTLAATDVNDTTIWEWRHRCDWSRGFPWRVHCTLDEYRREVGRKECPECDGTGTVVGKQRCPLCCLGKPISNAGTVPVAWAEQLLREHGTVAEIVLTDESLPSLFTGFAGTTSFLGTGSGNRGLIPAELEYV